MLECASGEPLHLVLLLFAVAVECLHRYLVGTRDRAVLALDGEAALYARLLPRRGFQFGVDEFEVTLLRAYDAHAFEHRDLGGGEPCAVRRFQRFAHIVQEDVQFFVENFDGTALLEQDGIG